MWRSMKTLYICCSPAALLNDLEDSLAGATTKTAASTDGRWHAGDKEEERKEQAEKEVGTRYGSQRGVYL